MESAPKLPTAPNLHRDLGTSEHIAGTGPFTAAVWSCKLGKLRNGCKSWKIVPQKLCNDRIFEMVKNGECAMMTSWNLSCLIWWLGSNTARNEPGPCRCYVCFCPSQFECNFHVLRKKIIIDWSQEAQQNGPTLGKEIKAPTASSLA